MAPQVGDSLPDVELFEGKPDNKVSLRQVFGNKTGVLFAAPGAFTPECSEKHLAGFLKDYDAFKAAGAEIIVGVTVNDPFVVAAWSDATGAAGKVRLLSDAQYNLTKALDTELDAVALLGTKRSKRYSAVIKNGKFASFQLEEGGEVKGSSSQNTLDQLKKA